MTRRISLYIISTANIIIIIIIIIINIVIIMKSKDLDHFHLYNNITSHTPHTQVRRSPPLTTSPNQETLSLSLKVSGIERWRGLYHHKEMH